MTKAKEKYYITSSIAYTNALPHLGYAEEIIQADVLARRHRLMGEDVFFLTGTDEHGIKIERRAREKNKTPEEFANEIAGKFKELAGALDISNDDFIRTTDKERHWPTVEKAWKQLAKQGDIYKKKYRGLYCVGCEDFKKEKDLINGECPVHQKVPEVVVEDNYFFRLSKYAKKVEEEIRKEKIKIVPEARRNEILSFIGQGVEDISISRIRNSLRWGIPVPGDTDQIIYVWFEALLNYLFPKKYWPADVHCLGKDIFRFHALMWPAMLLALGLDRPKTIFVHGYLTFNGQKMSKSLGNIVDPFELIKKYGADAVRYFLLREIPPTEDGDFTEEKFKQRYNADLVSGLGNLVARVMALLAKTPIGSSGANMDYPDIKKKYKIALEEFKFNEALMAIWGLIGFCDSYIEREKPWASQKDKVVVNLVGALKEISQFLAPFLPETSEKILEQLKGGRCEHLFPRIG